MRRRSRPNQRFARSRSGARCLASARRRNRCCRSCSSRLSLPEPDAGSPRGALDYVRAGGTVDGIGIAAAEQDRRPVPSADGFRRVPVGVRAKPCDVTRREFIQRRRRRVHRQLRRAGVSVGSRARAGRIAPEPGRAVPERRQRRVVHARAVHRSVLLSRRPSIAIPPANVLQVGTDSVRPGARPAPAPHRTASRFSTTAISR